MSRLTRDGTAEPVSRDEILRRERGQQNINFPFSADHEQDWQLDAVGPHSCYIPGMMIIRTYIHTYGLGPVHRMGTGTGTGTEARTVAEMGTGTRITGTGTRIGSGRAEERRKSARNRKMVVDAVREMGDSSGKRKNVEKKGLVQ